MNWGECSRSPVKSKCHGSESLPFLGPRIVAVWLQRYDCKDIDILNTFKNKVNNWKPENCPCRLCKVYINNIGFVWEQKKA